MNPPPPLIGIAAVLTALVVWLGALGWWQRRYQPHPELARKLAHIGMGLVTLSFGWLFDQLWPVWTLCVGSVTLLAAVRWWRPLRPHFGGVLGKVERDGGGEFYFAFSVALLFWLARNTDGTGGPNLFFIIPMLILTLADAVGALVGVRYGQSRYASGRGHKSVEGSLAFFLVAFFSTHIPLLLFSDTGRAESLLIGLTLGLLVMILEAVCWHGADNLSVPLASFVAIRIYLHLDLTALVLRFAVLTGLTLFMLVWRRRTRMDDSAPLAGALVLYLSWALGGWTWLVGPAALLAGYTLFCTPWRRQPMGVSHGEETHSVVGVTCVASGGLCWLFAAWATGWGEALLLPFTLAFAAHLGMIALVHLRTGNRRPAGARTLTEAVGIAAGLGIVPYVLLCTKSASAALGTAALGLAVIGGAVAVFDHWQERMDDCPADTPRWFRQGIVAAVASLSGLAMVNIG